MSVEAPSPPPSFCAGGMEGYLGLLLILERRGESVCLASACCSSVGLTECQLELWLCRHRCCVSLLFHPGLLF